jgi:hypothetical protein
MCVTQMANSVQGLCAEQVTALYLGHRRSHQGFQGFQDVPRSGIGDGEVAGLLGLQCQQPPVGAFHPHAGLIRANNCAASNLTQNVVSGLLQLTGGSPQAVDDCSRAHRQTKHIRQDLLKPLMADVMCPIEVAYQDMKMWTKHLLWLTVPRWISPFLIVPTATARSVLGQLHHYWLHRERNSNHLMPLYQFLLALTQVAPAASAYFRSNTDDYIRFLVGPASPLVSVLASSSLPGPVFPFLVPVL